MPAEPKRILIVDDDQDFVEALACFLDAEGFGVLKAYSGAEGLRVALMERPDAILMDIMMGERTEGLFVIRQMRASAELKDTPIFVVSSLYEEIPSFRVMPENSWLSHEEFFPKPVDTAQLLEKIRARLGPAQTHHAA